MNEFLFDMGLLMIFGGGFTLLLCFGYVVMEWVIFLWNVYAPKKKTYGDYVAMREEQQA